MRKTAIFAAVVAGLLAFVVKAETCMPTNIVVVPLTDAHWTQNAPYNDYSPKGKTVFTSGWEAGCVATAAAQELYFWQWPWRLDAVHETSHPVLNESNLSLRFDGNVPFDWESMQNSYGDGATLKQKHAVAHLVLACQSLVQMRFVSGGGEAMKNLPGTMEWYEYAGSVTPRESDANLAALRSDFEWGSPVQTGINFKGYGGHEVVGLGYATGTNSVGEAKNLIWLNLGWGGSSDDWYDIAEESSGETIIKSVQLGFRPIKSVQIEPVAPVSGSSVTLNWHLPNCYTNKISGFAVAKKTPSASTTTWTDDFSTGGKGRSSNTNELLVINERLYGWQGTASGIYTYDDILLLTDDSVLTYKYHDDYMAGCMSVRVEAKIGNGAWQTISKPTLHGGWNYAGATTESVNLGAYAGKYARFRFAVEYTNGSLTQTYAPYVGVNGPNVWFDDLSVSNVKTFETVSTDSTIAASARSTTFSGLTTDETYAFSVTPIMSDGSAAVTQTATTTIGTPAAAPTINAVTMSPKGSNLVQEGFYADIAMGWNIIDVACSESVTSLEAFISHQSVLPQSKIEVIDNGSGSFSINIDATEVAAKWANQKMILTLKATNASGESVYKDVELCLKASGVPENIPGGKVWSGASAMFGAENYTAKWTGNVLPSAGDKVTFKTTDADYGGEMNLNLSTPTTLGYVYATGLGQLTISGTSSETLTANVLKNDIQLEINTSKLKVDKAIPSANIVIDSGSCLDCEIDQAYSGYLKKVSSGYISALTDSSLWKGTVVFANYTAAGQSPSNYGNAESTVRLNGVAGWLANNTTFTPAVELVDDGTTPALNWNNGSTGAKETFKKLKGSGTFKTSGSGGAAERVVINDIDDFTGSFDLSLKRIAIGENDPTTSNNGSLSVNSGKSVAVHGGSTWKASGGFYFGGSQTITVNGTLNGAISANGTGTTLALAPTATVTAASLSFANNTIRIAKTAEESPTFSVTGAANLTNATIEVSLAGGMSAGDSIALMSAGSFEGVDSATLTGLDGYSLEVSGGMLCATKDVSPTPDATSLEESEGFVTSESQLAFKDATLAMLTSEALGGRFGGGWAGTADGADVVFNNFDRTSEAAGTMTCQAQVANDGYVKGVLLTFTQSGDGVYVFMTGAKYIQGASLGDSIAGGSDASQGGEWKYAVSALSLKYLGPAPTAVWVAGEFDDDRSAHGGLEFALNGNTTNALGEIVIGTTTTLGAEIGIPAGHSIASVLVKYSIPDGAHVDNSVLASMFSAYDLGVLSDSGESTGKGYWYTGSAVSDGSYAFSNPAPSIPQDGYLLLSYKHNSSTAAYLGSTISTLVGGSNGSLHFSNNDVTKMAFGGPTVAVAKPWAGMVVKRVAIFLDEYLSADDLATYRFPAQGAVQPEDSDRYVVEPVASWVNDFKTLTKGAYTLSVSGTTAAKDDTFGGTLTIGDAAAIIDTTAASSAKMTVLVKYRAASSVVSAPVVAFGGMSAVGLDVGVYTKLDKTLAVYRNFSTDNGKPYDFETAPQLSATGGYVLCARNNTNLCMAYVGDSLDSMTGGEVANSNILFSNVTLTKLGIGGNSGMAANANDMVPFAGLEIDKVVVFNGYYTPDEIRYVPIPEDSATLSIADGVTWHFAAGTTRTYTNIGTLSSNGTIAITNASELAEGTYTLATWTTPQQYTTKCAGYGKVGTLVTEGLAEGLSARLIYGARGIYLRVDDIAKQAARKPLVVWCYGDSITEGYNAQATGANYRILLYQKLEMLGYNVRSTGVYGLSNGYNSVDPSGTPLTDQYKWHSAKHGATAGPTTLAHRSNLSENVDTLAIQAGTPDVALLLIGVNDIPEWKSESDRVTPVFKAWTNVVSRMVKNLPDTKIVVSTILYSDGTRTDIDPTITAINTQIKNLLDNLPAEWQGHVVLADLNSYVKSGETGIIYNDHLHPDWWGYDQMADGYLDAIVKCYPDPDATDFPSQNPIPAAPTADQLGAANKPELAAYRAGFSKLCNIRVEKGQDVSNVVYDDVNGDAASENIEKVGYFVEFVRDDNHAHKWVWVDMDAFGDADLASVGLPTTNRQQAVTRMHVCSNHGAIDNVAADDDSVTGWIEFSPYDYTRTGSNSAAPANYGDPFDWNDTLSESGSLGCMQVFRVMNPSSRDLYERPQLMFAFNNFQSADSDPDFGIGNFAQHFNCNNSYHVEDWTGVSSILAKMAPDAYSVKTIEIWTKENASAYSGPEPAAVWEDDFSVDALSEFDGFSIDDWQQTHGANMSSVTIDRANQGLLVDFTEAKGYVTVLVKYSNLAASSSNKRVLFATTANSDYTRDRCGIRLQTDSKVIGLWNASTTANNDGDYGNASTDTVPSAGTLAFVYDKTSGTDAGGVSAYVAASGESLPDSVLWSNHALKAGDIYGLAVGGMCRDAAVSGVEAAQGMTITGLAIFTNVLTVAEMNAYMWPSQLPPVDKEKYAVTPEAVWYKDFKTTAKTNDASRVYTLAVSGTTTPADDEYGSTLTIGNAAAVIDGESAEALTVLVKYRAAPAIQSAPVVTFGGDAAVTFDSGICTGTTVDRQLAAYYSFIYNNARQRGIYAVDGNPTLSSDGGYLVCARKYNECLAYVGDSLDNMTGGVCTTGMQISNSTLRKIGIGGQTELSSNDANMVPLTGFVVEKVVVFNGYYTPDQIRYVAIPEDSDTLSIANGKTWRFAAGTTRTYTNIGTLSTGGTIAITNAATLAAGTYTLATWTTAQKKSTGYGHVGTLDVTGLPAGLSAELVYGAKAIYLRVWNPTTQAEKGTIKVWPYGDSITEGFNAGGTRANYRVLLAQKLSMLGYNVEMVGCYDKINGANGLDPSGQAIPDAWKWHSAKHGATAGPTTSAAGRANLCENVDTLCAQAGNPDVVLLLAGANDIVPATGLTATQVVASVTNIVAHLAANLPDTKIVIGNQINVEQGYNSGNYNHVTKMIPQVNALLKNYVDNLPEALAGKVFLADLNSYVKSGEYGILFDHGSDHLHPDWWGHDQMAEGWLSIVTNQFTSTQTFPSATIPSVPTSAELGAAAKAELADYRDGYTLCRTIDAASTNVPSVVTGEGATEGIEKVAYFVEYVRADNNAHKWVWVDMDAFGTTIGDVGLPSANHQQVVTKLHVKSNHNGIENVAANDDTVTGFIEFSPYNYDGNASGVSGAPAGNGSCCDWNDTLYESGSYSCMQVHRIFSPVKAAADGITRGGQVLFAYNNWQSSSSTAEFGIGNFSSHFYRGASDAQTLDYTYTANATKMNASAYSVKRIEIWTKEKATDTDFPTPYSWIDMYFPGLVSGWDSTQYNDFATNKNHGSVKNGYAPWESYVLGLDPTNETSKFIALIRMAGTTPIVEFSPTNEVLKSINAIEYILQGKPALTNGWQDVEFDEPGDTNRFFRVRVKW